ncbi:MAG TPA: TolC family outer membrane protein [Xanthobacteraceae bacterium]|jgi:outer membrane protein
MVTDCGMPARARDSFREHGLPGRRLAKRVKESGHRCAFRAAILIAIALVLPDKAPAETIQQALASAYEDNPQLNAQRALVRQSDEGVAQALSGYRPTLSGNVSVGREHTNETEVFPPIPGTALTQGASINIQGPTTPRSVGVTASQTLFNGAQTANKVRAAESQVFAARETLRVMEQSVLLAAATVYMDMLRDSASLEVQQTNVKVLDHELQDTRQRFAAGQITDTDVAQAEAQLAGGEATLHAAESTLMTTRANYRRIIGHEPENLAPASPVERLAPSTLNAAIAAGTAQNPSVTAALYGVDVAVLQVKIAEGALWPSLTAQANVDRQWDANLTTPKLFTESAMLNLSIPFYQGGAEYSTIRQDKEAVGQQRLNVDQVRDQARADVVEAWGQLLAAKAQVEAAQRQVAAAERALTGVRNEALAGQRTTQDVLNAQQVLVNARLSLIIAQHDRVVASYSLLSAVGRLSPQALDLPVSIYDPTTHYHQVRDVWFGLRTPSGQ